MSIDEGRLIEAQEEADAEAIQQAEELVLRVAAEQDVESLQQLRDLLAHSELGGVDSKLIRVAIWRLLNADRLQLTEDRRLQVAG
jgi:HD-GYP domain-containing protein (c-di-GMP phosphodiesterase class II)